MLHGSPPHSLLGSVDDSLVAAFSSVLSNSRGSPKVLNKIRQETK
jgi:hypothetical protein